MWILIITAALNSAGVHIHEVQFTSRERCLQAANLQLQQSSRLDPQLRMSAVCVPK